MKALLILGLALLLAAGVWWTGKRNAGPNADFAEKLYRAGVLNAAGRDELLRRMQHNELKYERTDPLTQNSQEVFGTTRASVLNFCAEAFQAESAYRMPDVASSDLFIAGQAPDSEESRAARQEFAQELKRFGGDTSALVRYRFDQQPARCKIEQAIPAEDSLPPGGWTIYPPLSIAPTGGQHWISERRSVWGKTRTRTARDLQAVGLLDAAAYRELQQGLQRGTLFNEMQVCQRAADLMQRPETFAQGFAEQQQWLQKLERAGLLSAAQRRRLTRETRPNQLKSPFDVVGYCEHGRIVDLRAVEQAPQQLYPALFRQAQALLPALHYTDLHVTTGLKDEGLALLSQTVTISFRAEGRRYANTFVHSYRRRDGSDPNPEADPGPSEEFHQSLNRWLADRNSPLRLYQAHTPDAQSVYGSERLGLLAMTAAQRRLWGTNGYFLSQESHDNRFSSAGVEQLLATYQALGLFAHLSPAEIARGRRDALAGQKASFAEILLCFPRMLYVSDGETANPPYPYAALARELAAMSRGGFAPTQVQDGFGPDYPTTATVPFGFTLGGQRYRAQLAVKSDWMDPKATELINRALQEQHAAGQFYDCADGEGLIFLTPRQYEALHQAQPDLFETPRDDTGEPAF
ncbi:hypothetical protein [Hymenobacter ruricola]|uniref:Uncharacterized protein n=1 Tax=Hymenobacter ruricola TaxID=2791023 RepID=A0ABS0I031_9BACT|nr:hypothetical protein [Hymenobacter ruricola]MBF9220146.1 hypothetical protein [Hymenobacter ruricola]